MQNQNIRPIPNDDEWPLATVFDVTAKLAKDHHHNDDIFISRRQNHISTQMNVLTRQTHSTSTTSAIEPHLSDGVNTTVDIEAIITCNV